jgi:hypothetical protein
MNKKVLCGVCKWHHHNNQYSRCYHKDHLQVVENCVSGNHTVGSDCRTHNVNQDCKLFEFKENTRGPVANVLGFIALVLAFTFLCCCGLTSPADFGDNCDENLKFLRDLLVKSE